MKGLKNMARYKYYTNGNQVICVSSYAKIPVKGVAKCSPEDVFNEEIGKQLARLRCDAKIAKKRVKNAKNDRELAAKWCNNALDYYGRCGKYYNKSLEEAMAVTEELNNFINNLKT